MLAGFCSQYSKEHSSLLEIVHFKSTRELLSSADIMSMDVIILDIMMDIDITGVDAACTLRQRGYQGALLFITISRYYYAEGFEVGALRYLVKPVCYESFCDAMSRAVRALDNLERYITVTSNRRLIDIPLRHILYAVVEKHRTILHTTIGDVPINIPLAETQPLLSDPRFLKCYRSNIVNMDQIMMVENMNFRLTMERGFQLLKDPACRLRIST